ncbi:hypothetical protein PPERSA_08495 [Pseudocohnilembus persalinus]|uniref:Uncharacterized protein n=1 Tax=Pseudocohnilembus persalinus TaxID=266149 RepID=A0A0V0R6J1_PSEPJ|nr:hypothetical protein PPERSA_08495 [Pseudocohnilembus persalinus]|eukprot:KRX10092.1 hypothetical protein PPERSA_08495 [Pseudocohnilembus persalinus]
MSQDNIEIYKKKLYYVTKKSTTITDQEKSKIYQAIRNEQSQTVDDLQMLLDEQLKFEIVLEVCENVNQLPDDFQQDEQATMIDSNKQVDNQESQNYDQNLQKNNYNQYNDNNQNNGYYQQQNDYNSSYSNHNQQNQQYSTQNYSNSNISQNQEQVVQNYNRQYQNYDDNNSNNNGNIYKQDFQQSQQQNQYDQYPQQRQQLQMQQNQLYSQNIGYNNNLRAPIKQQNSAPSNNQRQQQQSQPIMQQSLSQHSDQSQNQMVNQLQPNQKRQSQQYPQEQNQDNTPQKKFDQKIQDLINSTIDIKTDTSSGYEQYQSKFNELRESIIKYKEDNKDKLEQYQDPNERFTKFFSLIPTNLKNFLHETLQIGQQMLNNILKKIISNIEKELRGKDIDQVLMYADEVGKIYRSFVEQAEKTTENKSKKSKKNQQKKEESARPSSSSQINQKEDSNQIGQKLESAPQKNEAFQKQQQSQINKSQQLITQNSVNLEKSNISSNLNIQKNISTNANTNKKSTSEKQKQPAKIIYEETKLPDYTDVQKQKIKECQNLFNIKGIESHLENKTNLYSVRNLLENELPLQFKKYMSTVLLSCIKEAYQERNGEEFQLFSNNNVYQEQKTVELFGIFKGQKLQPRKKRNLSSILSDDNPYKQKQIAFEYAQEKNFAQIQDVIAKKIKLSNRMDPFIDYQLQDRNQNEFCQNLIDNLKKEQEKQDKNQEEQNNQKKSKKGNKNPIDEMQKSQTLQDKLKSEKNQDQKKQQEEQKKQQQQKNEQIEIDRGKQLISLPKEINYNHLILHLSQQQDIHSKKILQKLLLNLDRTIRK